MKKILSIIFILTMVALTGCFGGKESTKEVTYEGQLKKLKVDVQRYQTNIKRAGVNTLLGEGIYINVLAEDGIAGYEGWYYYDLATITGVANEQLQELLTLMGVVGPKGRVYFVFGDNYVNPFDYTSIEDTRDNGTPMDKVEPTTEIKQVEVGVTEPTTTTAISTGTNTKPYATGAVTTTTGGVQFAYANQISTGVVNFYKGETFTVSSAAITTAAGVAKVTVALPATIGEDTVYTVKSNDIYFGTNNSVTVAPKAAPTITTVTAISGTAIKAMVDMTNYTAAELTGKEVWLESDTTSFAAVFASVTTGGIVMNTAEALTDTAIYTVTSDFFTVGTVSFTARIGAVKKIIEAKTTDIVASTSPSAFFTVENQYGEVVTLTTTPSTVTVTKNGLPVTLLGKTTIENNTLKVRIDSKVVANDVLVYTFGGNGFEPATFTYTVITGENVGVVTSIDDFYLEATKTSIAAKDTVTFTAIGYDPYDSPVVFAGNAITWYITGPEGFTAQLTTAGAEKVFTPELPGTYSIKAALASNTQINKTVSLAVGVAAINKITVTTMATPTMYSKDGTYYLADIKANSDAATLTPEELTVTVTNSSITAADLNVTKVSTAGGVAVKVAPVSAGAFTLEFKATRGSTTVTTVGTITKTVGVLPTVATMTFKKGSTVIAEGDTIRVKKGFTQKFDVEFKNKYGEAVITTALATSVLSNTFEVNSNELTVTKHESGATGTTSASLSTIITKPEGADFSVLLTVQGTNPLVSLTFDVEAYLPTLAAISAVANIPEANAVVAADPVAQAKYHYLSFADQDTDAIAGKVSEFKITVTTAAGTAPIANVADLVELANSSLTSGSIGWITSSTGVTLNSTTAGAIVNSVKVLPKAGLSGTYTVKIESKNNAAVSKTFTVFVGSKRVENSMAFTSTLTVNLVEEIATTVTFEMKDQYGSLINAVTPANFVVVVDESKANLVTTGAITNTATGKYSMVITAGAVGTGTAKITITYGAIITSNQITVNVNELNDVARVEVVTTTALTLSALGQVDAQYEVVLKAKAYDSNDIEIALKETDITWNLVSINNASVAAIASTQTAKVTLTNAANYTVTVSAVVLGKTGTYTLKVDNDNNPLSTTVFPLDVFTKDGKIQITSGTAVDVEFGARDKFGALVSPAAILTSSAINPANEDEVKLTFIQSGSTLVSVPTLAQITEGTKVRFTAADGQTGSTTVVMTFVDNVGTVTTKNFTVEVVNGVVYDNIVPTATVTTATIKGGNNITTAQSTEVGTLYLVTSGAVTITGAVKSVAVTAPNTNTNIPTTGVASGTYKVIAVDPSGNASAPSTNEITVDATAPIATLVNDIKINFVENTGYTSANAIKVQSTEAGKVYLIALVNGNVTSAAITNIAITTVTSNTAVELNITAVTSGAYKLYSEDLVGNLSTMSAQTLIIDRATPTAIIVTASGLNMISPTVGYTSANAINVQSTEIGTAHLVPVGDTNIEHAATVVDITTENTNQAMNIAGIPFGEFQLLTVDLAGNVSNLSAQVITIDRATPTAIVTTTSDGGLLLTYNEPLANNGAALTDGADVKALYTYSGTAGNYTSATYISATNQVLFVITGEDAKTLTVASTVTDLAGNKVDASKDVATYTLATTTWALD